MCQIVVNTDNKNNIIPANLINNAWRFNNNGWGIMRVEAGTQEILVDRGLTKEAMLDKMERYQSMDGVLVLHLRAGSNAILENCHPFKVSNEVWMCHNGYIETRMSKPGMSDTWHYAKYVLKHMLTNQADKLDDPAFIRFLGKDVGIHNRIVLLRNDGKVFIVNEHTGFRWRNLWVANTCGVPTDSAFESCMNVINPAKKNSQASITSTIPTLLGGDKIYTGYLVSTPGYFNLNHNTAWLFFNMNQKLLRNIIFSKQEMRFWEDAKRQVQQNLQKADIKPGMIVEWCRGLVNLFLLRQTDKDRERIEEIKHLLDAPIPTPAGSGAPIKKRVQSALVSQVGYQHECVKCKKVCDTNIMWFTDEEFKIPIDARPGMCEKCKDTEETGVIICSTPYTYTPKSMEVVWRCSTEGCKACGYTEGSHAGGTKEAPLCYQCKSEKEKEVEKAEFKTNLEFCGLLDFDTMTEFETNYWKNHHIMKDFIKDTEVVIYASTSV